MFVGEWSSMAVEVFGIILCFQVMLQIVETYLAVTFPHRKGALEDDAQMERRKTNETHKTMGIAGTNCTLSFMLGFSLMPFLYFNESSVFRSHWFDIYMTCCIWVAGLTS